MPRVRSRRTAARRPPRPKVGGTFNKLTIVAEGTRGAEGRMFVCRCECGNERALPTAGLKSRMSCGCLKPKVDDLRAHLVSEMLYRCAARARKLKQTCDLTFGQIEALVFANCHYCGTKPASVHRTKTIRKHGTQGVAYNGIDRENAFEGYTFINSRTCCDNCNSAKMQMTATEYVAHCARVVAHSASSPRNLFD